tara:strand:- start:2330 stop:3274 length:945 start_codon:yes stop_codon:yes gene_type:complete
MDLGKFFASIRASVFNGRLPQSAVDGCEAILASCRRNGVSDPHHVANILAQVWHETGGYMLPIKETVFASHKDKNPSDATVIARLDRAFAAGQLSWVRQPYWREGWFGRGPVQLTHEDNYRRMGDRLGVDLVGNPSLALDPAIGADIAVVGMSEGRFTGKKLADFDFPAALEAPVSQNPRRIVNGQDGTDAKIAKAHRQFFTALRVAGFGEAVEAEPVVNVPIPTPRPPLPPDTTGGAGQKPTVPVAKSRFDPARFSKLFGSLIGALVTWAVANEFIPDGAISGTQIDMLATLVGGLIGTFLAPANAAPPEAKP